MGSSERGADLCGPPGVDEIRKTPPTLRPSGKAMNSEVQAWPKDGAPRSFSMESDGAHFYEGWATRYPGHSLLLLTEPTSTKDGPPANDIPAEVDVLGIVGASLLANAHAVSHPIAPKEGAIRVEQPHQNVTGEKGRPAPGSKAEPAPRDVAE